MRAVVDTVAIQHIARLPKKQGAARRLSDALSPLMKRRRLIVVVDKGGALIEEWRRTAGPEAVQVLVTAWEELGGIEMVDPQRSIPEPPARKLRQLQFDDAMDRAIVRIALSL